MKGHGSVFRFCLIPFVVLCFLHIFSISFAATHYIDYKGGSDSSNGTSNSSPWKRSPGMVGFEGNYTPKPGDVFVFKGGVTWPRSCFPLNVGYSGASGSPNIYTSDRTWYIGASWSHPVFDGEGQITGTASLIYILYKNHLIFDSLKLYRTGIPGVEYTGGRPFQAGYVSNITIRNCIFEPYANFALVFGFGDTARENIFVHNNDFSNCTNSIVMGGGKNHPVKNIYIYNNYFHNVASMDKTGDHPDGIHLYGYSSPIYSFQNVKIYNNRFYGDWGRGATAQIYFGEGVDGAEIYNNVLGFDNTTSRATSFMFSPGMLYIHTSRDINIYNNTISSDALYESVKGGKAGIVLQNATNVKIRNNIISRTFIGVHSVGTPNNSFESDSNLIYIRSGGIVGIVGENWYRTFSSWQAAGYDTKSLFLDPKFVNISTQPFNWKLQPISPAIAKGVALSSTFTTDIEGILRPNGSSWDLGAYQYNPPPAPPRNLRLNP